MKPLTNLAMACCLLLPAACAAKQIRCEGADGRITYMGRYDEETAGAFIHEPNAGVRDFYSKRSCHKVSRQ